MGTLILLKDFEKIYNNTYKTILKYVVLHCNNLDDVNDIIQETYVEFYKKLKKNKKVEINTEHSYLIGICKNILKKYYRFKYQNKNISILSEEEYEIPADYDLEIQFITKENVEDIWKYLKNKDIKIAKVFYLYYGLDMKIIDISKELGVTESATKNYIYRTLRELKDVFEKGSDKNEGK